MKHLLTLIYALALVLAGHAAPADETAQRTLDDIRAAIRSSEEAALRALRADESQAVEEINAATLERVVRELGLTAQQRERFDPLYKAYRQALADAVTPATDNLPTDSAQQQNLKRRLDNISAAAQVKRDYVDRFAAVLTAEQIRRLYNAEGEIGTSIKRASGARSSETSVRKGEERQVTRDWGEAGDYTAIAASTYISVTVSPTARTIQVTADERLIDYLEMDRTGGVLRFRFAARRTQSKNFSGSLGAQIVVPASASLRELKAASYGSIVCHVPLRAQTASVSASSYGRIEAQIDTRGKVTLALGSYGRFRGSVSCGACDVDLSSYGSMEGDLSCTGAAEIAIGSYARLKGDLKCGSLDAAISSGASLQGDLSCSGDSEVRLGSYAKLTGGLQCRNLTVAIASAASLQGDLQASQRIDLEVASYAKHSGRIAAPRCAVSVASSGSVSGTFAGGRIDASVGSYGKCVLKGSARVEFAQVSVASGGSYSAPELRVETYDLTVASSSRADVRCERLLQVDSAPSAKVTYDGPCTVVSDTKNIRKR